MHSTLGTVERVPWASPGQRGVEGGSRRGEWDAAGVSGRAGAEGAGSPGVTWSSFLLGFLLLFIV